MPQDLCHEHVFAHQLVQIDVALLLEVFNELELAGRDDRTHKGTRAVVVTHLLLVLLEDSGNLCADGVEGFMATILEGCRDGVRPVLRAENTLGIGIALELDLRFIWSLEMLGAPGLGLWGF